MRIASWAGFWGDTPFALDQVLTVADIDYLVSDHLAEVTLALLARSLQRDPHGGYIRDAVTVLSPRMAQIHQRGMKVITNAGALNPRACAEALQAAAAEAGTPLHVAWVEGDDLRPRISAVLQAPALDMFTGEPIPEDISTLNAYLGATPIREALSLGADIVVTGRCADAAVVLGPLLHEFGWADTDYDLLSSGMLVGHILECGPQSTGGLFSDWASIDGWDNMGYPIAECNADGTATITKPDGTGGRVSPATVAEQVVYEIADPGAYVLPDVVCDWRNVRLVQAGPDRVEISGATGAAPTASYKATATHSQGYRALTTIMFAGHAAGGRARRAGQALVARVERLVKEAGCGPFQETSVEVIGAGDALGHAGDNDDALDVVVKVGVRHTEERAVEIFAGECAAFGLVAQGMTGYFAGRPRVAPVIRVFHTLVDKESVSIRVHLGTRTQPVAVTAERGSPTAVATEPLPESDDAPPPYGLPVRLADIAYARSGDKGNSVNIGVIAHRPEFLPIIRDQVTATRVSAMFAHYQPGNPVRRWELPGLAAINIMIPEVLGGKGGNSTLRYDAQGKSFGAMLLTLPVVVPETLSHHLTPSVHALGRGDRVVARQP